MKIIILSSTFAYMKRALIIAAYILTVLFYCANDAIAQCAICSRTAQQMGEKPAAGLNGGILYLMAAPFLLVGFIGYRWWKHNGREE
jgi:hypothetical protein